MIADLRTLPFSRKGSWMVLSELNENWNGCGNEAGLYLRTVHSSAVKFCGEPDIRKSRIR